jgi:hypothetical protein
MVPNSQNEKGSEEILNPLGAFILDPSGKPIS